ncbi:MAG: MFS transporter [Proteobacteria bacterium]|nr:MFS transporter [Pseudomonadota bacterium]
MTGFLARLYAFKAADAFILIYPLYAVMFVEAGLNPAQVALALAVWSVSAFVLEIPAGVVADRLPRRVVLAWAQVARLAGYGLWMAYPHFWGFVGGFLLWGVKSAFTSGTFEALVYDELAATGRQGDYARVIGRADAVQFIAILAASGAAALVIPFGYRAVLAASLAACAAAAVLPLTFPKVLPAGAAAHLDYLQHLKLGVRQAAGDRRILDLVVFIALMLAFGAMDEFWSIFAAQAGLGKPAIALVIGAISAGQAAAAWLAHRAARLPARAFYALAAANGLVLLAGAAVLRPAAVVALIVFTAGFKVIDTVFEARLQAAIPDETRATVASVKGFATQLAVTGLFLGFGPLAAHWGYRAAFLAFGAAVAAVGGLYLIRGPLRAKADT